MSTRQSTRTLASRLPAWCTSPEFLLGAWLNSFLVAMIVGQGKQPALLFLALACVTVLVVLLTASRPARFAISPIATWGTALLLGSILLGYAANLGRYEPYFILANFTSLVLALAMAYLLATRMTLDYGRVLAFYAAIAILLIPIPLLNGEVVWGRLTPSLHPNFIGMIAMLTFIGALAIPRQAVKWFVLLTTMAVMLAVQSRGSMIGSLVALVSFWWCRLGMRDAVASAGRSRHLALGILLVVTAGLVLSILDVPWLTEGLEALLKLNDPRRGITTGASGRTELWAAALTLWEAQPFLGVGFKGHESLMPDGSQAHNAYLGMLAETGIVGLGGYLLICGSAVAGLVRLRHDPTRQVGVAVVVSYIVYGLVETRAVNFGNPYSIVFLWIALDAGRRLAPVAADSLLRGRLNTGDAPRPPTVSRSEGSP